MSPLPFAIVIVILATTAVCQTRPVPVTCPVTPRSQQEFVPPTPYPAHPAPGRFWFGTERLWTSLDDGQRCWSGLPHYTPDDPRFRQKLFWWRSGFDPMTEPQPALRVTGRRLDAPAPPLARDEHANAGWTDRSQPFIVTGIFIPTIGCWEITGHYNGDELTFVVWVTE